MPELHYGAPIPRRCPPPEVLRTKRYGMHTACACANSSALRDSCTLGLQVACKSRCPSDRWQDVISPKLLDRRKMVFVNVGANKGYRISDWIARFWSSGPIGNNAQWQAAITTAAGQPIVRSCGQCQDCKAAAPHVRHDTTLEVHALELLDTNVRLLNRTFANLGVPGVVFGPVAVSNYTGIAWVRSISGRYPGDEGASAKNRPQAGFKYEIPTTTVDAYAAHFGLEHIHMLAVDAEGWDPLIVEGAQRLLDAKRVDFLEFEFNNRGKWSYMARDRRDLRDILQLLHVDGYRCYWLGGDVPWLRGRLALANGAGWCESFGFPMWSNLVCTHLDWAMRLLDGLT